MARSPHIHTYDMSHPFLLSYTTALLHFNAVFCCQRKKNILCLHGLNMMVLTWGVSGTTFFLGEKKNIGFDLDFF